MLFFTFNMKSEKAAHLSGDRCDIAGEVAAGKKGSMSLMFMKNCPKRERHTPAKIDCRCERACDCKENISDCDAKEMNCCEKKMVEQCIAVCQNGQKLQTKQWEKRYAYDFTR
jgi:hypothetical protein